MTPALTDVDFAIWSAPGTPFRVLYPPALFQEIDFVVNEGYRSIPYGGVEIGGLLFGRKGPMPARIEAFRTIECEHVFGPSFVLSERDLTALGDQIKGAETDLELSGLECIGWFISHTRKSLAMDDRESALFDRFFPEAGKLTLLIKPERFKPTRFGFVVRGADGRIEKDVTQHAIILPLSGRTAREANAPIPSIPAPLEKPVAPPAPIAEAEKPVPSPATAEAVTSLATLPARSAPPPIEEMRRRLSAHLQSAQLAPFDARSTHEQSTRRMRERGTRSDARPAIALVMAAALGCAVGCWGYLQLPSAIIPLSIRSQPPTLLVSWPPQQTRDAAYAAIRVDDGEPVALSSAEKSAGEAAIGAATGNIKIEVIAQHWMRDSRGIARYVTALKSATPARPPLAASPPNAYLRRREER